MFAMLAALPVRQDRRAMTAWEYALISAVVAVGLVGALNQLGAATFRPFATISSAISAVR